MPSELVPTEDEFETIIQALGDYSIRVGQIIATEEVLKATQRIADKAKSKDNGEVFTTAFGKNDSEAYLNELQKEINKAEILEKTKQESDKLTLTTAKVIRLRDECRRLGTINAIDELLK